MVFRKHIPNTLTCLNLVSGCIASVMALEGLAGWAVFWIVLAAVFDFTDGLAARLLKSFSPIGKELDSLADVVSFGVAPGMMLFHLLREACVALPAGCGSWLPWLAFIIPAFSGLRLAKFNIDSRQATSFIGLPVPANALFWAAAIYGLTPYVSGLGGCLAGGLLLVALGTSLLLVSEIPMFSLKIKSLAWKGNELQYILLLGAILFIVLWGIPGISVTILLYIFLSIFNSKR